MEEVSAFNKLFPIVDTCLSCEDTARQSCDDDFARPVFSASRVQEHISDMRPKFALRPHHVWKYGRQDSKLSSLVSNLCHFQKHAKN